MKDDLSGALGQAPEEQNGTDTFVPRTLAFMVFPEKSLDYVKSALEDMDCLYVLNGYDDPKYNKSAWIINASLGDLIDCADNALFSVLFDVADCNYVITPMVRGKASGNVICHKCKDEEVNEVYEEVLSRVQLDNPDFFALIDYVGECLERLTHKGNPSG